MESAEISPLFQIKREESWCSRISGWKLGFFDSPTRKLLLIHTFLENKTCLSAGENNLHQTAYLRKSYLWTKNLKEIDFSFFNCHLLNNRYFLTTGSLLS